MFIPRSLFSSAYAHLKSHAHPSTTSVLILCALDADSLCAARILASLLKRDYILHQIKPVAGYQDLEKVNETLVKGNEELKFIICLGMGGLVDLSAFLELSRGGGADGVECWIIDGRRPWNLYNVYGGGKDGDDMVAARGGKVIGGRHGVGDSVGGIKCFDDGDIAEEMEQEKDAFKALIEMPEVDDDSDSDDDDDDDEGEAASEDEEGEGGVRLDLNGDRRSSQNSGRKRKSSDELMDDSDEEDGGRRSRRIRRDSDVSSDASTPVLHRHTLLSHSSSRPLGSSPPPLRNPNPNDDDPIPTSPSQHLPSEPPLPPYVASAKSLRRKLRRLRRKHESTIASYYSQGTWYGEPISSLLYSLAADLGREDNDILWLSIVGVCAGETYGRTISLGPPRRTGGGWGADNREDQIRGILKDEVRRLNPPDLNQTGAMSSGNANGVSGVTALQTTARSPSDTSIRISPEYRFMLIRHWSLYDSMLHSSYLGTKLHIWSEHGRKRLHKLLAKMGFSLSQCKQNYTHMDMDLKRSLKEKLERYAPLYGLDGVVKEGFVRCWGWRGCLSAADVAYVVGGILEVGKGQKTGRSKGTDPNDEVSEEVGRLEEEKEVEEWITNFWDAYDALTNVEQLKSALPIAMNLHRAILRTGTALIEKRQIRLLRAFRLAVVKEGPDLPVFTHPNALSKLALWISEAIMEQEREASKKKHLPLVVASLNERRGVYVVVGTALGAEVANSLKIQKKKEKSAKQAEKEEKRRKREEEGLDDEEEEEEEDSDDDSDDEGEEEKRGGRNRFGIAFQEVANSTQARIRIDSFEATVVEVKKEDLAGFLEGLSLGLSLQ
ncbi:CDC45 family [Trichophaea hybrida]|nr:CDC45 family [Trichophaea hybrida]